jgi:pimeloyl-ACP methyl ester carboxylesterase
VTGSFTVPVDGAALYGEPGTAPFLVRRCRELAARLPGARHEVLTGMAHQPYLEDPGRVAGLITAGMAVA